MRGPMWHRHSCLCFGKLQWLGLLKRVFVSPVLPSLSSTDKSVCATQALLFSSVSAFATTHSFLIYLLRLHSRGPNVQSTTVRFSAPAFSAVDGSGSVCGAADDDRECDGGGVAAGQRVSAGGHR